MLCAEWWGFEVHALLAGLQGGTQLASQVPRISASVVQSSRVADCEMQTVLIQTIGLTFMVPLGLSIASTTRVGNALGANNPEKAALCARVALIATAVR